VLQIENEERIKREIKENGPILAASYVYLDMLTYKSGVYE